MIYVMYNGYNYNIHKYTSVLVIKSEDKRQSPNQEGAPGKIVTIRDLGSSIFYAVVGKKEDWSLDTWTGETNRSVELFFSVVEFFHPD